MPSRSRVVHRFCVGMPRVPLPVQSHRQGTPLLLIFRDIIRSSVHLKIAARSVN